VTLTTAPVTESLPNRVWRNRIIGHAEVAPAELVPNPRNWRTHPAEQQRALAGALAEVGWVAEVLVNRTTGNVVDGHLRIELALARAEATVPVTYIELSEDEERLILASLDPIGALASAEAADLAELLAELAPEDEDLRAFLEQLGREEGIDTIRAGLVDADDVPDLPDEPSVDAGELFVLGDHRLLCGDSTDPADVRRLFGDAGEADLLWTDPPYGVAYQTKLSAEEAVARHRRTDGLEVANDALTPEATRVLLTSALREATQGGWRVLRGVAVGRHGDGLPPRPR
jgi:hypothetical protein